MYPCKIWPQGNPRAFPRFAVIMRRAAFALLACMLVFPWAGGKVARAQGSIRILAATEDYVFAESLRFELEAQSASPIVEVILFYGMADQRLVRRIYPAFVSGKEIQIIHTEPVEPGQFAPGTSLRSWWRLRTQDGAWLTTETHMFQYADKSQQWRTLAGDQVDLFWYGRDENHARDLLTKATEALNRLRGDMGVPVTKRIRIYVYNSQSDMRPALSPRSEGYDEFVTTLGVAMGEDALVLLGTHREVDLTIAHELSHIVVGIATDNPYTDLPRWLDEGLAMYAQGDLPAGNQRAVDDAVRSDTLLSIRSMTSYSGQAGQVDLFYGAAFSIVDWMLRDLGRDKMQQLLAVFADGVRQEDALQRVYGFGLDELDNRWRASLGLEPRHAPTAPAPTSRSWSTIEPAAYAVPRAGSLSIPWPSQQAWLTGA
jgi:hypothetical protein